MRGSPRAPGKFAISRPACNFGLRVFSTIHMSKLRCFRISLDASRTIHLKAWHRRPPLALYSKSRLSKLGFEILK